MLRSKIKCKVLVYQICGNQFQAKCTLRLRIKLKSQQVQSVMGFLAESFFQRCHQYFAKNYAFYKIQYIEFITSLFKHNIALNSYLFLKMWLFVSFPWEFFMNIFSSLKQRRQNNESEQRPRSKVNIISFDLK